MSLATTHLCGPPLSAMPEIGTRQKNTMRRTGTDLRPLDVPYAPPAVELPAWQRRPAAERAVA
ncbi:hypothetical protein [Nocardia sienata]|uniref:hypothetical protein n=1 Tax=Nocardia sienata TaxID=248552 RepID=UPI0007A4BD30|nr:hypothetical protein [Nocardia sienata]